MIALIDTDILIDVALNREPFCENAVKTIDCMQIGEVRGFVAWHSLSNFYYLTSPKIKSMGSREFIFDLCQFVNVAKADTKHMLLALGLKMNDFNVRQHLVFMGFCIGNYSQFHMTLSHFQCDVFQQTLIVNNSHLAQ